MITIQSLLETNGPMLSSEIKKVLVEAYPISEEAARQQISRAKGNVKKLTSFKFPKNEGFLFLNDQYKTSVFYHNLYKALLLTNSATGNALAAINCLSGNISVEKFNIFAGSLDSLKRKSIASVKKELLSVEYIQESFDSIGSQRILLSQNIDDSNELSSEVIDVIEELIFGVLQDWIRKNGLGSYNKIKRNSEYAGYYWDITAPTYLLPFTERKKDKINPGFLVLDILPQTNIRDEHVKYFISKVTSISSQKNMRPMLPMLIALSYSTTAFNLLKQQGILVTTVANLIGEESSKLLNDVIDVVKNTNTKIREANNDQINNILKNMAKFEGKFNNIKGHLFEMMTANIIYCIKNCYIEINRKIYENGIRLAEIDVMSIIGKTEIYIIECKAYNSLITDDHINNWKEKIAVIFKWIKSNPENNEKKVLFEFWSVSGYTDTALILLKEIQISLKKYSINWQDKASITTLCRDNKLAGQLEIIQNYF